jgi:hypothetical protein
MQVATGCWEKMISNEAKFPPLRPLQSLAEFCEFLLNSQIFNTAIRLLRKGVIRNEVPGARDIHAWLTMSRRSQILREYVKNPSVT